MFPKINTPPHVILPAQLHNTGSCVISIITIRTFEHNNTHYAAEPNRKSLCAKISSRNHHILMHSKQHLIHLHIENQTETDNILVYIRQVERTLCNRNHSINQNGAHRKCRPLKMICNKKQSPIHCKCLMFGDRHNISIHLIQRVGRVRDCKAH